MQLDSRLAPELNGVGAELNRPFDDAPTNFFIAKNVTEREFDDYGDLVILEVMVELAGCNQDRV